MQIFTKPLVMRLLELIQEQVDAHQPLRGNFYISWPPIDEHMIVDGRQLNSSQKWKRLKMQFEADEDMDPEIREGISKILKKVSTYDVKKQRNKPRYAQKFPHLPKRKSKTLFGKKPLKPFPVNFTKVDTPQENPFKNLQKAAQKIKSWNSTNEKKLNLLHHLIFNPMDSELIADAEQQHVQSVMELITM